MPVKYSTDCEHRTAVHGLGMMQKYSTERTAAREAVFDCLRLRAKAVHVLPLGHLS